METYKYSKTGSYHVDNGTENQDFIFTGSNDKYDIIVLADGVSTCKQAQVGAELAATELARLLLAKGEYFMNFSEETVAELALAHVKWELNRIAENDEMPVDEYSSTLAAVLREKKTNKLLLYSLGNALLLGIKDKKVSVIFQPGDTRNGTIVTTTIGAEKATNVRFVEGKAKAYTSRRKKNGEFERKPIYRYGSIAEYDNIIILSDGAWKEVFKRGRMDPAAQEYVKNEYFELLEIFLKRKNPFDDCSFVTIELNNKKNRRVNETTKAQQLENYYKLFK